MAERLNITTDDGTTLKYTDTTGEHDFSVGGSGASAALDNLASVAINTTLVSDTDNTDALGTSAIAWSDLFLGNESVITWNSAPSTADLTLTHSAEVLTFAGGTIALGTATATGGLTGNVTGDVTGSAGSCTGEAATVATITGLAPDTATTAAAQPNITSLGTLTGLTVEGNILISGTSNELRFYEGVNYVGFEAPALDADQIWVLPDADGTDGQALVTDGSGALDWATFVGSMTSFTLTASSGTPQTIVDGNTLTLTGSTGITTVVGDTDTVTFTSNDAQIVHDDLSGFETNEHIDHTAVTLTAGTGLTGGGDISANRTFNVDVGIGDDKIVQIDSADVAAGRYGVFTANGLDGWTKAEVLADLGTDEALLAGSTITDNAIVRGDGGSRGTQDSGILIDDSDNITAVERITAVNMTCTTAPSDGTDVVNKTYADGLESSVFWDTVRVATTAGINLSTDLENGDTIDGITLVTGDRVLVKNQQDLGTPAGEDNGIYVVVASGAASRATDADSAAEIENKKCIILEGTVNETTFWFCTTDPITLGTTAISFAEVTFSGEHNSLGGLNDGDYKHLTAAEFTGLTTGAIDGLSGFDTDGIVVQTATGVFTGREIEGTTNEISVANGTGVAGNPTLSLPDVVYLGASGVIGRDADNTISFATDNTIQFKTNGTYNADFDSAGDLNLYQNNLIKFNTVAGRYTGILPNSGMATSYSITLPIIEGAIGTRLLVTGLAAHVMTTEWKDDIIPKEIIVFDSDTSVATGDGAGNVIWTVPEWMDGWGWVNVEAQLATVSSSGGLSIAIYNVTDSRDALTTDITFAVSTFTSQGAVTPPVINALDATLTKGDRYRIDVGDGGTGAKGLSIAFYFIRK